MPNIMKSTNDLWKLKSCKLDQDCKAGFQFGQWWNSCCGFLGKLNWTVRCSCKSSAPFLRNSIIMVFFYTEQKLGATIWVVPPELMNGLMAEKHQEVILKGVVTRQVLQLTFMSNIKKSTNDLQKLKSCKLDQDWWLKNIRR